jgi:hypothetical protein
MEAAMGRHSVSARRRTRSPVLLLSVLLVAAVAVWFTVDLLADRLGSSGCDTVATLNVVAAEDIAPSVAQVGRTVSEDAANCYTVTVLGRKSATVTESLAVSDGTDRPDVWIPESTLWLRRAQDLDAWQTPVAGTSIANSPVVLAVTDTAAVELGWPDSSLSWAQLIGPEPAPLAVGITDPGRDPVGVSVLLGLRELVKGAADPGAAGAAAMRKLSKNTVSEQSELFDRLPGAGARAGPPAEPLAAVPTSENAVLRHNAGQAGQPLVAVYADPAVPSLDYPFVVLPETSPGARDAAKRFLTRLIDQTSSELLADAGFRTPDGKALRDRSQNKRTTSAPLTPVQTPETAQVEQVRNAWAAVNLSGRLQVLLDVSGSMNAVVPGTGESRMRFTTEAAAAGFTLLKSTTKLGMWQFSTKLDADKDYSVLLPVRTVGEHLAGGSVDRLRAVKAVPNGATALYDTILAAYQDARRFWEPGRINAVVVLTDGKDDNASDVTLEQLLGELGKLQDPQRPLPLIGIGIGPDVDQGELKTIAEATGGQEFIAADPSKIGKVFYAALSRMICQPPACQPGNGTG